jgi:hypothetical protein
MGGLVGLIQFVQPGFQVRHSLVDAVSFMPGAPETVHEAQCGVVGLLCVLDFVFPCSGAGRGQSNFTAFDAKTKPFCHDANVGCVLTLVVDQFADHAPHCLLVKKTDASIFSRFPRDFIQ